MSASQVSSCEPVNDSNIPLPKRVQTGTKIPRGCTQLPELQKYIDTIIKASNECESDSTSTLDKDKYRKERKSGKYSVYKGLNNKIKYEKVRLDLNSNKRKGVNKSKSRSPDAVSSGETTPSALISGFEDPRNWKFNKIQSTNFSLKVEKFLRELYPNPYHLDNLNEFYDSRNSQNDTTGEGTLSEEAVISQVKSKPQTPTENNDLSPAVAETNPTATENIDQSPDPVKSLENVAEVTVNENSETIEALNPELNSETVKQLPRAKSQILSSDGSSSQESVISPAESLQSLIKRKGLLLNRKRSSKEMLQVTSKPSVTDFGEKRPDSDIGKLKLLSTSDSNSSVSKKRKEVSSEKGETDYFLKTNSKIYKQEELNDLRKIHEVMKKANKSFLLISEKNQNKESEVSESAVEDKNLVHSAPGIDENLNYDLGTTENEEPKNCVARNDEPTGEITPKVDPEEPLKPSPGISFLQVDNSTFKSDPECSKAAEMKSPEIRSKSSLNFIEQRTRKELKNDDINTSQKIDEVLEFMYDCLMKFSNSTEAMPEEECRSSIVRRIFSTNQIVQPTTSKLFDETDSFYRKRTPQNCQKSGSGTPGETSRKRIRTRCRKSDYLLQPENKHSEMSNQTPPGSAEGQPALCTRNSEVNNETYIPTAETQNELGGYAEVTQDDWVSSEGLRLPKPVFPVLGSLNKGKTDTRSLREVLETEEKLFSRDYTVKERTECVRPKELFTCKLTDDYRISETSNSYSLSSGFKCPSSNFVICVNSLPRNLKTFTAVTPVIALPQCPPMPLINIKESREVKQVICKSEFSLKQLYAPPQPCQQVLTCTYRLKQGSLFKMNKLSVKYTAMPICEKVVNFTSELQSENSLKSSECSLSLLMKSIKSPQKVSKINRSYLTIPNKPAMTESGVDLESEEEKRVDALVEAIEDAEGKILFLQQMHQSCANLKENPNCRCKSSKTTLNEYAESDFWNSTDRKTIQDLLLRTYNLQLKLQECLNKITSLHPSLRENIFREKESFKDFKVYVNDMVNSSDVSTPESNEKPEKSLSLVHWYPVPRNQSKEKELIVFKVDHGTSYNPPADRETIIKNEESNEPTSTDTDKVSQNYEEDNSSICSFKSSNDFSETSATTSNAKKESKSLENLSKSEYFKKIYNEIELIRQNFEAQRVPKDKSKSRDIVKCQEVEEQQQQQNSLVQYNSKTPGKMLKTVFKGRESSTELTIGLKDIPMTQVKNISVEKTKLSPNHTKISICISKDQSKEVRVSHVQSEILHNNRFPAYSYKHLTPSLKGVFSAEEDDVSKSSQSSNDESEDEEYKSAGSTVEDSDTDADPGKSDTKEQKSMQASPQKKAPKHRFDFYQKMKTNFDEVEAGATPKITPISVCRYKELEPLKQAMTEMQIRMRSIKRDALYNGNDYYERALKLAKMSAGYCQSCGNRAVIPNDTFGYYKTLIPRRYVSRGLRQCKTPVSPDPSFYSFRSSNADVGEHFCDLDIKHSSYLLNRRSHSNRTILRGSLQDMPVLLERM